MKTVEFRKMAEEICSRNPFGNLSLIDDIEQALRNAHNQAVEECAHRSCDLVHHSDFPNSKQKQGEYLAKAIRRLRRE